MRPTRCLQFLRPFAWRPLEARNLAYLRFYRAARHQELAQADALKYPRIRHDGGTPMRIPEFREKYGHIETGVLAEEQVVIRGRVQFVRRSSSKLVFFVLKSDFEPIQGMVNFKKLEGVTLEEFKKMAKLWNRGDIISVTGQATRTEKGELTIQATRMPEVLTPGLVPLPVHLDNEEARMSQRHIDMLVNQSTLDTLRLRAHLIKFMRDFFHARDFLEFQTPILAQAAGGAVATPFTTVSTDASSKSLALRVAPELWLKRLVVGGVDKVFELGPSFRNEGIDQTHNPEFTTCEFYSAYANLGDLISLTEELIWRAAGYCRDIIPSKLESLPRVDMAKFKRPFRQMEFIPSIEAALGFSLPDLAAETALDDLLSVLQSNDINLPGDVSSLPKLLDQLAATYIEPHSLQEPLFITNHPVCMSPLSKTFVCPKTGQTVSARAELFVDGKELANMYEEENDPFAQRQKFIDQARARARELGEPVDDVVIDEGYVQALEAGLPPTGGWGCGIERLVMLFAGTRRISDCLSFGNLRNVVAVSGLRRPEGR